MIGTEYNNKMKKIIYYLLLFAMIQATAISQAQSQKKADKAYKYTQAEISPLGVVFNGNGDSFAYLLGTNVKRAFSKVFYAQLSTQLFLSSSEFAPGSQITYLVDNNLLIGIKMFNRKKCQLRVATGVYYLFGNEMVLVVLKLLLNQECL